MSNLTPFQTIGPFFQVMLRHVEPGVDTLVTDATQGQRIEIEGTLFDGAGVPVTDALVEIWQADSEGRYRHPEDPKSPSPDAGFWGYGRVATDHEGKFRFVTVKPGSVPGPDGAQAPHVLLSVLARGVLTRYITRAYFEGEASNDSDTVLKLVPENRRQTLLARKVAEGRYRFDVHIQGPQETVFFDA